MTKTIHSVNIGEPVFIGDKWSLQVAKLTNGQIAGYATEARSAHTYGFNDPMYKSYKSEPGYFQQTSLPKTVIVKLKRLMRKAGWVPFTTLCVAMGDGSRTEQLGDDFHALADVLYEGHVEKPPFNWSHNFKGVPGSFTSGPYQEPVNQIFLYWGDEKAEYVKNLTKAEQKEVERRVAELFK